MVGRRQQNTYTGKSYKPKESFDAHKKEGDSKDTNIFKSFHPQESVKRHECRLPEMIRHIEESLSEKKTDQNSINLYMSGCGLIDPLMDEQV